MGVIVEVRISELIIPQGFLPRVLTGTVYEVVERYAQVLRDGGELDPLLVWKRPDRLLWVADGAHRVKAHQKAGRETIKAELREDIKNKAEFRKIAISANLKHGLALTPEERVENARLMYRDGWDDEEIAKTFGVSLETVRKWLAPVKQEEKEAKIRRAVELRERGMSLREIAKELGMTPEGIRKLLSTSGKESQKLSLLTSTGTPTPEGLKLFSDFVLTCDYPSDLENTDIFLHQLREKGYEVSYVELKDFLSIVVSAIKSRIESLTRAGLSPAQIKASLIHETEGIFQHLSISAKKKLSTLLEDFINEIKERVQQDEKLSSSPNPPSNSPLAGSPPALFKDSEGEQEHEYEEEDYTEEEEGEVKELEPGIPLHRPIPPREKLYEMAYGGEEEKEEEVRRPPSRYDELEKTIVQIDACVKWIYAHFGKEKALSVLQKFYDEISALPESELAKLEGNL